MPLRFMGKWMNSNNHCEVTDQTFAPEICQRCTFDRKKEIPYWDWPVNEPLNTFQTLELLFPIFKRGFVLVLNIRKCMNNLGVYTFEV